jgi:pilus assembly protein Flp/PilA
MNFIRKMLKNEEGATAIEYGLIAALIAVAAITAMQGLGTSLSTTFGKVSTEMNSKNGGGTTTPAPAPATT